MHCKQLEKVFNQTLEPSFFRIRVVKLVGGRMKDARMKATAQNKTELFTFFTIEKTD
jgi:methionine-rich copper-binding protein CopC